VTMEPPGGAGGEAGMPGTGLLAVLLLSCCVAGWQAACLAALRLLVVLHLWIAQHAQHELPAPLARQQPAGQGDIMDGSSDS